MFYSEVSSLTKNEIETILESEGFVLQMTKPTKKQNHIHTVVLIILNMISWLITYALKQQKVTKITLLSFIVKFS